MFSTHNHPERSPNTLDSKRRTHRLKEMYTGNPTKPVRDIIIVITDIIVVIRDIITDITIVITNKTISFKDEIGMTKKMREWVILCVNLK